MDQKNLTIDKATFEKLCRGVCQNFVSVSSRSAHKEALLFAICQEVYSYLGEDFVLIPMQNSSHLETYKSNLQLLVSARRSNYFNILEILDTQINETLDKSYRSAFHGRFAC